MAGVNIFVLCTGRCGSTTFTRAAQHISNFTARHESRVRQVGPGRLAYPPNHIEVDNRLSWLLGRLDETYGNTAKYVHLTRDPDAVARSFNERWDVKVGIISAYKDGILMGSRAEPMEICADYVETITANIRSFLKDKSDWMDFRLENAREDWRHFWEWVGAQGDLEASLEEWSVRYNATPVE